MNVILYFREVIGEYIMFYNDKLFMLIKRELFLDDTVLFWVSLTVANY